MLSYEKNVNKKLEDESPFLFLSIFNKTSCLDENILPHPVLFRVVLIQIQVSQNASNTAKNAGISISEYARLCSDPIPCNLYTTKWYPATCQLAQLPLTDVTYIKTVLLGHSKTVHSKFVLRCHCQLLF